MKPVVAQIKLFLFGRGMVGGFGIVGPVKAFVQGFEEFLLFLVVVNLGGAGVDGSIVVARPVADLMAHGPVIKGIDHLAQALGDVVFQVKLGASNILVKLSWVKTAG